MVLRIFFRGLHSHQAVHVLFDTLNGLEVDLPKCLRGEQHPQLFVACFASNFSSIQKISECCTAHEPLLKDLNGLGQIYLGIVFGPSWGLCFGSGLPSPAKSCPVC